MNMVETAIELPYLACKNRVIRSAVHSFLGSTDGYMTEAEYGMYEELAKNNIGLLITGHCAVSPKGRANPEQINIFADEYIPQFTKAAEIAHKYDAKFVVQISHAGPRAVDNDDLADVVPCEMKKNRHARALTLEEIAAIERAFVAAAVRAKKAGVDGVQLHAAHSYLLSRFIDKTFNQRTDEYGGTIENRFRICENIIRGIKEECGQDFPVLIKINNDSKTDDGEYEGDMIYMLRRCKELGVSLVECSGVDFLSMPRNATLYYLDRVTKLRRAVDIPLSLVGGVRSLADMEKVIAAGIDMVSLGRALVTEPDFVTKVLAGQEKSRCVSCNRCFVLPHLHAGIRCVFNRKKVIKKAE